MKRETLDKMLQQALQETAACNAAVITAIVGIETITPSPDGRHIAVMGIGRINVNHKGYNLTIILPASAEAELQACVANVVHASKMVH